MDIDATLRNHLIKLLRGKSAHVDFDRAIENFPEDLRGKKPAHLPYTAWQLLEHLRIAQWDILEFSRNPGHVSPEWPRGYWPRGKIPPSKEAWENSIVAFKRDLKEMQDLITNPAIDLYKPIPHGTGQTILREALLVADHNAYHLGQLVMLRRILGVWPGEKKIS